MQKNTWYYEKWVGRQASFSLRLSVKIEIYLEYFLSKNPKKQP
jgi:hypothetical protein